MRRWSWVRRGLALALTVFFLLSLLAGTALAKGYSGGGSRSFSSGSRSSSGSSRSFSTPKSSTSTPKSYSTPKSSTSTPKSYSSPAPSTNSTPNRSYSSPSNSYSGGSRSYSSPGGSYSSTKPSGAPRSAPVPAPSYDTSKTRYSTMPPIVIYGNTGSYDPWYWHDYYYGRPWYWRVWHRPVFYSDSGSFGLSWVTILVGALGAWILLGMISAAIARRRRY